jgi:hypothetical protein
MKEAPFLAGPGGLLFRPRSEAGILAEMTIRARQMTPLETLNPAVRSDFTSALMSSWAQVCDILSFYQQRIANEGYLATALEPLSVVCLAAEIGERRRPAVGASADVALRLVDAPATADGITLRPGPSLTVQNAPATPDTLPAVFECAQTAELRPEWNALASAAAPAAVPATLWPGCRSVRLSGTSSGLRPGGALLLTAGGESWLAVAETVVADRTKGCTLVTWANGIPTAVLNWKPAIEGVTVFQQTAGLFGRTAQEWSELPDKQKQAIGVRQGGLMTLEEDGATSGLDPRAPALWRSVAPPPPQEARLLLSIGGGRILAATSRGVYRLNKGADWQALPPPPRCNDLLSLHAGCDGKIYAGTADGAVLASADGGESWAVLPQTVHYQREDRTSWVRRLVHWKRKNGTPPVVAKLAVPVRAIATRSEGAGAAPVIYAGTDQGVYVIRGGDTEWRPLNSGMPRFNVATGEADVAVVGLIIDDIALTAATASGVFVYRRHLLCAEWALLSPDPDLELPSLVCTSAAADGEKVFVGTSTGIFSVSPLGFLKLFSARGWMPKVSSLAAVDGRIAAATDEGIFITGIENAEWDPIEVQEIDLFSIDPLFAKDLDAGAVPAPLYERFERFGIVLAKETEILPLYDGKKRYLRIGWQLGEAPPGKRVFRIYRGKRMRVTQCIPNAAGGNASLAAAKDRLFALLPLGPVLNEQWPDFAIDVREADASSPAGAEIFLDRRVTGIEVGSTLVVAPSGKGLVGKPEVHKVLAAEAVVHKAFGRQGIVTRVVVKATAQLLAADLRASDVYVVSRTASPFTAAGASEPVAGDELTLSGVHAGLAAGGKLQLSGPRAAAAFVPALPVAGTPVAARAPASAAPALDQQMVTPGLAAAFAGIAPRLSMRAEVTVVAAGRCWLVRDGDRLWRLAPDGEELLIFAAPLFEVLRAGTNDLPWLLLSGSDRIEVGERDGSVHPQAAASTQPDVAELATIATASTLPLQGLTRIALASPLANLYDSAKCAICANIVHLTQGETVLNEVLGRGDPTQAGQSFRLHRSPLTYSCDEGGYRPRPAFAVEVNGPSGRAIAYGAEAATAIGAGERWREVETLAFARPGERVYSISTDGAGRATLHFGDGSHGARLPAGADNVSATYRYGAGKSGNVSAGSLVALRKRPAGIRSATNPCAASGGTDAETIESLRLRAPRALRCCERIVTLGDYAAFAEAFPGVLRAQATILETRPGDRVLWLSVAAEGPVPISKLPQLSKALAAAIDANRADAMKVRIADPLFLPFDVRLALTLRANAEAGIVEERVRAALGVEFSLDSLRFGSDIGSEDVAAEAGSVPGVESVELVVLHLQGALQGVADLRAWPAFANPETGGIVQAQWPLINAATGITIERRP